jgi:hypothetical protein
VVNGSLAQTSLDRKELTIGGQKVTAIIEGGDTIIVADLARVDVTSPKSFKNYKEYRKYMMYKRYASKVYPYAKEAIRIFSELENEVMHMKKSERRKHIRRLQRELETEFKKPLKKLTKTQGYILIKMIERELNKPMYYLIKEIRNGVTARTWAIASGLYGYKLKDGYQKGNDLILDIVLEDLELSNK